MLRVWLLACLLLSSVIAPPRAAAGDADEERLDSVIRAMLTMQRKAWEQGVCAQALMEAGRSELAALMAREAVLRQTDEGRLATLMLGSAPTDAAAPGEVVLRIGRRLEDASLLAGAERCHDFLRQRARKAADGTLYHTDYAKEMWIDSMYMAPPFLAAVGDYEFALQQVEGLHARLWNPEKKLYHHVWDDERQQLRVDRFWGVGNGWALAGLLRTAEHLPAEREADRARLVGYFRQTLDACLGRVRPDGLAHFALDEPETFVDTAAPMLFAYAAYRGVELGWLDREPYLPQAEKMRRACLRRVDANGFVTGACGLPDFETPSRAAECQAFFILMESARQRCGVESGQSAVGGGQ